ncbi:MAG TPA: alpha/beta fold hydrolase [Thermoplasmata archaeon]|nr:alpha/beta fold hydrolase [Thermoplasmata archaeon]
MAIAPGTPAELYARDEGTGVPVVLLHGLGGDHTVWNGLIPGLAREFRVLAPDLRGHGRTVAPPGSTFTFDELAGDLWAFLDGKGLPAVHLVGLSAGGFLALQAAIDRPDRLRSLTVVAAGAHCDRHTRAIGERWAETFRDSGFDAYVLRLLKDLYYPDWVEAHMDYVDRLRSGLKESDGRNTVRWGLSVRDFDVRGRVARIRLPTLVVHGMDDAVVDVSHARILRQSIPGAEMRLLAQTGHLVPIERPEELLAGLTDWIRRVEARGPASAAPG